MKIFNLMMLLISLTMVILGFNLKYDVVKKVNYYHLKFLAFFNSKIKDKLNINYSSTVKIIGNSDISLGMAGVICVFLYFAFENDLNFNIDKIINKILIITLIIDGIIVNWRLKKIK